ncbi:uncharacterized protein LOC143856956 [Tasmannia lanceolata]|uniref:uncharacterized protein LOC143856956 n=1 Tax=Tasmannia lanceolata TaxID=3420 RepID=UPI00406354E6
MRLSPKVFKESTTADDAESWLENAEKAFEVMNCNKNEVRVKYATYMLEGRALHWWKGIQRKYEHHQGPFTWAMFRTEFLARFFSRSTLYRMQQEFTQLVQGDMTVDDYEAEFDRLARFVPSLVPDDEAKRNKFEFGLAMYLKKEIAGSTTPESYEDLVERAKKLEAVHQEVRAYAQANQKKRNRDNEIKGGQVPRGSAPNQ